MNGAGLKTGKKGERTRAAILDAAIDMSAEVGLEGLTFGTLAARLELSKSGLFTHFADKRELQLAALEAAQARFVAAVFPRVLARPRGLPRLWELCAAWLAYAQGGVFAGGCFFAAVAAEYSNRPGPVREKVLALVRDWNLELQRAIGQAIELGHLAGGIDREQLAFELHSLMAGADNAHQLFGGDEYFMRAWVAIRARVLAVLGPGAPRVPGLQDD